MKPLLALLTGMALCLIVLAQGPAAQKDIQQEVPGLEVLGARIGLRAPFPKHETPKTDPTSVQERAANTTRSLADSVSLSKTDEVFELPHLGSTESIFEPQYQVAVALKNTGTKAIRAVDWTFLLVDPVNSAQIKRYDIHSKQQIAPGESKVLLKDVSPPTGRSSDPKNRANQKVIILRVEYVDGTTWKRS